MLSITCTCAKLRRAARIVSAAYDEALAPAGLTVSQFSLMTTLQRFQPCSLSALAEATGHDRTTLNRSLKPLEAAGFIRSAPGEDQRMRIVEVSAEGRAALRKAHPRWEQVEKSFEEKLGGDHAALSAILGRIEELRG